MSENIKIKLKSFKNPLVLLAVFITTYISVVTGKLEFLSVAMLLAGAEIVYFPVKEIFNKNLDKGDKHDNYIKPVFEK